MCIRDRSTIFLERLYSIKNPATRESPVPTVLTIVVGSNTSHWNVPSFDARTALPPVSYTHLMTYRTGFWDMETSNRMFHTDDLRDDLICFDDFKFTTCITNP